MKGKTFFVTGGNTGIGFVTARYFAARGANIGILSLGEELNEKVRCEIEALGAGCLTITGDVTCAKDVAEALQRIHSHFGGLHYAFNNAGIAQNTSVVADQSEEEYDAIMAVDVKGVWLALKHEIPLIIASGGGAIVNSASAAGVVGVHHQAIYCAAKHAVVGLTRGTALDHAADGVRINAIAPGVVNTEMIQRFAAANAGVWDDILAQHPMGTVAEPEEVASAVYFLCEGATKTTGSVFSIDCGMTI